MAVVSSEVPKQISSTEQERILQQVGEQLPQGVLSLIFSKDLNTSSIPILFKWAQSESLEPFLCTAIGSFFQEYVADLKGRKELQEVLTQYYADEFRKTKPLGVLSEEEQSRVARYSEYFCLYLVSERGSKHSREDMSHVLNLFSFSRLEAFFSPEKPSGSYKLPLGQPDKHSYLGALYSKGIHHEQLRDFNPSLGSRRGGW